MGCKYDQNIEWCIAAVPANQTFKAFSHSDPALIGGLKIKVQFGILSYVCLPSRREYQSRNSISLSLSLSFFSVWSNESSEGIEGMLEKKVNIHLVESDMRDIRIFHLLPLFIFRNWKCATAVSHKLCCALSCCYVEICNKRKERRWLMFLALLFQKESERRGLSSYFFNRKFDVTSFFVLLRGYWLTLHVPIRGQLSNF